MLGDIALAQDLTSEVKGMQQLLDELRCTIRPLEKSDERLKAITAALDNTAEPALDKVCAVLVLVAQAVVSILVRQRHEGEGSCSKKEGDS